MKGLILEIVNGPDRYFWYTIAISSIAILLKMINSHMGKIDKTLEKLEILVSKLITDTEVLKEKTEKNEQDITDLKRYKGGG